MAHWAREYFYLSYGLKCDSNHESMYTFSHTAVGNMSCYYILSFLIARKSSIKSKKEYFRRHTFSFFI